MFKKVGLLCLIFCATFALQAQAFDLNGVWDDDTGGTYYIRQIDKAIWWYGESNPTDPEWSNVAKGKAKKNSVSLDWADVPKGAVMQNGTLKLNVISEDELEVTNQTGGFLSTHFTRVAE